MARAVREHEVLISEVAGYELRRELLFIESNHSVACLDELTRELTYITMAAATRRTAARLWATLCRAGKVHAFTRAPHRSDTPAQNCELRDSLGELKALLKAS